MSSGYYRFPTISDQTIVFTCEDDLWAVDAAGGVARRLTASLGEASRPRLSPDGAWLAYVSREEGAAEIYRMPAAGGPAARLTYQSAGLCMPLGWGADGRMLIVSNADQPLRDFTFAYWLDPQTLALERLPVGPVRDLSFGPQGQLVIGRNTADPARWKRYRGGTAGQVWIDEQGQGQFRPLIDLPGNLAAPLWIGERIYFLSDHEGFGNLYSCSPAGDDLRRHTDHADFYARNPSSDGRRIVYHAGAEIYLFDPATDQARKVEITTHSQQVQRSRKFVPAGRYLDDWVVHPSGQALAVTSRGRLFVFAAWEGPALNLAPTEVQGADKLETTVRYRLPAWLKDGRRLVAVSDAGGEETFVIFDGDEPPQRLEGLDIGRPLALAANPRKDQLLFSNHRYELCLLDLETRELQVIDRGIGGPIAGFDWSPDGEWAAYAVSTSNQVVVLKLWQASSGQRTPLTRPLLADMAPSFDPSGKYLYFISARTFDPVYDRLQFDLGFPRGLRPYLITLQKDTPNPFVPQPRLPEDKKDSLADKPAAETAEPPAAGASEPKNEIPQIRIDLDGIQERMVALPVPEGLYGRIHGIPGGKVIYTRLPVEGSLSNSWSNIGPGSKATLYVLSFDDRKEDTLIANISDFDLTPNAAVLIYRANDRLRLLKAGDKPNNGEGDAPSRKSGWIDLSRLKVRVHPGAEWRQMFREAWRLQRDQFWTPDMSQVDWLAVHDRYLPLVERLSSRSEFSDLIWEMQGELGTSHAYELGGDYRPAPVYALGSLGADFAWEAEKAGWRITHIVRGDAWEPRLSSPLLAPGANLEEGDVLLAVNGQPLRQDLPPGMALLNQAGEEVSLRVLPLHPPAPPAPSPGPEPVASPGETPGEQPAAEDPPADPADAGALEPSTNDAAAVDPQAAPQEELEPGPYLRTVTVRTLGNDMAARYREWVENNRRAVHAATQGRVGYVHIPDMGPHGFAEFHRGFLAELERQALIVDVRFNGGGHVSPLILEKLARRRIGYNLSRWGQQPYPYPPESVAGPIVALTNEYAGSDGDIFSHGFKMMKLGPLLGKRTWGGVVGINPSQPLLDGSLTTQPEYAFWFADVGWQVENYGTDPDIEVDNLPQDYARGVDAQLQRAIAECLALLEQNPPERPDFGARPTKSPPSLPLR